MKLFKTHTSKQEIYVWYNADLDKCVSGTASDFEVSKTLSKKPDEFQMICLVGNDQSVVKNLTNQINQNDLI